uniref:SAM domain-containing protein n=1 Tax=Taeniopygia guttata TaxID=59729 RepID=A0A674HJP5_TAEGU
PKTAPKNLKSSKTPSKYPEMAKNTPKTPQNHLKYPETPSKYPEMAKNWLRFFEDAGIPPGPALGYAVAFVDNRIHKDMLLELTKELMKDLGVTAVGDVIAILRHARLVHRQGSPGSPRIPCLIPLPAGGSGPTAAPAAPRQRRVTAAAPGRYRIPRIPRIPRISRISPPQAGAGRQILRQIPPAAPGTAPGIPGGSPIPQPHIA